MFDELDILDDDPSIMPTMPFGKHAGMPLDKLPRTYLSWMLRTWQQGKTGPVYDLVDYNQDLIIDLIEGAQVRAAENDNEEYQLSPSQQAASDGILAAFESGESFVRLEGGAGYGKSFAVRDVVRNLLRTGNYFIQATAVSYVATQVLKGQLDRYNIECGTLARMLRMEKTTKRAEEIYGLSLESESAARNLFFTGGVPDDEGNTVAEGKRRLLIIDEYSMINDEYARFMATRCKEYGGGILVVGDLCQLPPVKQDTDTIFAGIPAAFELTDPMRYSRDSDLYLLEQAVREDPRSAVAERHELALASAGRSNQIFTYDNQSQLFEAFCQACKEHPHEDNRILFYRRQDVVNANNAVREFLFGKAPVGNNGDVISPLMPGERLMIVRTSDYEDTRYYTGDTLDVIRVIEDGSPYLKAELSSGAIIPILFAVNDVRADSKAMGSDDFNERSMTLAARAKQLEAEDKIPESKAAWADYMHFRNSFVFVAYSYATTVHKSQGATVDRIFVSPNNLIDIPKVGKNLTYVALTRAKKEVHMA